MAHPSGPGYPLQLLGLLFMVKIASSVPAPGNLGNAGYFDRNPAGFPLLSLARNLKFGIAVILRWKFEIGFFKN
jgi:hypothetical protein